MLKQEKQKAIITKCDHLLKKTNKKKAQKLLKQDAFGRRVKNKKCSEKWQKNHKKVAKKYIVDLFTPHANR